MMRSTQAALCLGAIALAPTAIAQTSADPAERDPQVTYPAAFYAAFQPQTALDMLQRTPGFTIESDDDTRGFSANAGNVVINGQRPTVKTGGLTATVGRISAGQVERIELIRGGGTADTMGRAVVANIVLRSARGGSGSGSVELRRATSDSATTPQIEMTYARPVAGWQTSASVLAWYENNPMNGIYRRTEPIGTVATVTDEQLTIHERGGTLTIATTGNVGGGTLGLNARAGHEREAYQQTLETRGRAAPAAGIDGIYSEWNGELGVDWSRTIGHGWSTKLVALGRAETSHFIEASRSGTRDRFGSDDRMTELVARVTVQRQSNYRLRPELGAEVAWNRLDNNFQSGNATGPRRTLVAETRSEVFVNGVYAFLSAVKIEGGIAFERSRIGIRSGTGPDRQLQFWKPNLSLIWDVAQQTQIRFGFRRTVGQLDFEGFAASGDLINDRPIAGNGELRPERIATWSGTIDRRFGQGGAIALTVSREAIDDALAYIPLSQGGQALANSGSVNLWRFKGKATLPVDAVVAGGRFTVEGDVIRTRRIDPLTRVARADAREKDNVLTVGWRQDIPRTRSAWGLSANLELTERQWFVDQDEREQQRPAITAYAETILPQGVKATLTGWGLFGYVERRRRLFYQPNRTGTLAAIEDRTRRNGPYLTLRLARQF